MNENIEQNFIYFGKWGGQEFVCTEFEEIAAEEVYAKKLGEVSSSPYPMIAGLLSYDDFSPAAYDDMAPTKSRFFRLKKIFPAKNQSDFREDNSTSLLRPEISDNQYLDLCGRATEEIRDGRFYQINLLRYFKLKRDLNVNEFATRLQKFSGAYGCWFRLPDLEVISFSPEHFLRVSPRSDHYLIQTFPIKGTLPANQAKEKLAASTKDLAELSMITDLMRHDLAKIAEPGSVEVQKTAEVLSLPHVHHLQSTIAAKLKFGLSLGEMFQALCPAGSITGAPKIEVMGAIAEYERRRRGFFMGNAFFYDENRGQLEANVLIRTVVRQTNSDYEFAAGSGIVVKSQPSQELQEINAKCAVLSDDLER